MPRDSQRQRVYEAESVLESFPTGLRQDRVRQVDKVRYASREACQDYVNRVTRSKLWEAGSVVVGSGKRFRKAVARGTGQIELPIWARNEWTILHELAHCLTTAKFKNVADHGREFCSVYIKLVKRFLGPQWAKKLKDSFREHRVKSTLPRTQRRQEIGRTY